MSFILHYTSGYTVFLAAWVLIGVGSFIYLLKNKAPYGRYASSKWGPLLGNRVAWIAMELPALLTFPLLYAFGPQPKTLLPTIFVSLWVFHYVNRTFIYPLRISPNKLSVSLSIVMLSITFNVMNGAFLGIYFGFLEQAQHYDLSWLVDLRFLAGIALFASGVVLNWYSDSILLALRRKSPNTYGIPRGGPFTYISCPNYLGEITEWLGFALLTWAAPAGAFLVWTIANLLPRALAHHQWYQMHFPEYPKKRKALFPGVL